MTFLVGWLPYILSSLVAATLGLRAYCRVTGTLFCTFKKNTFNLAIDIASSSAVSFVFCYVIITVGYNVDKRSKMFTLFQGFSKIAKVKWLNVCDSITVTHFAGEPLCTPSRTTDWKPLLCRSLPVCALGAHRLSLKVEKFVCLIRYVIQYRLHSTV